VRGIGIAPIARGSELGSSRDDILHRLTHLARITLATAFGECLRDGAEISSRNWTSGQYQTGLAVA
jgi:hypothetical protein